MISGIFLYEGMCISNQMSPPLWNGAVLKAVTIKYFSFKTMDDIQKIKIGLNAYV